MIPEDLELARLRAEVAKLTKERDALLFAACGFCEEVDRADAYANRPRGGQQVSPSGDFVHTQPSVLGRLKWWARAFKDVGDGVEYAIKTLTAELDGARNEAAAAKRERDTAQWLLRVSQREEFLGPCVHGRDPFTRCEERDGLGGPCGDLIPWCAAVRVEREACAQAAEDLPARVGCDGGVQRILADDIATAIRARGDK